MNIWHDIDEERIYPTDFMAVVEISMGSNMKYELDKKTGMLSLDRVLFTAHELRLHSQNLCRRPRPAGRAAALLRADPAHDTGAKLSHWCHDHGGRRHGR